jgi:cell division septal protein FtsQ
LDILADKKPLGRMEKGTRKKRGLFFFILFFLFMGGVVYFLVYSPVFKVEQIIIRGINEVDNLNAVQLAIKKYTAGYKLWVWPKNNILFLSEENLGRFLTDNVSVDDLKIKKRLFKTMEIEGQDRLPVFLWQEGEQKYYINKAGLVMAAVEANNIKYNLPLISRSTTTVVIVGEKMIDEGDVSFIRTALDKIDKGLKEFKIIKTEVEDYKNREVSFYTDEGWRLIVDTEGELDKTLWDLAAFLKQETVDTKKLEYIDIRIPNKIFYK